MNNQPLSSRLIHFLFVLKSRWFLIMSLALLAFIILFPKIPLFDLIPGYIVRARTEDFLVAAALVLYGIQLMRGKAKLFSPVTGIFVFYVVVGILSILNAMFLVKTVPLNLLHVGKMFLHFARRIEYFSLFFVFYTAVRRKSDAKWIMICLTFITLGISLYGFGQKYLYWPVFSTMNREFSKGVRLVLTANARVPSTFGGHYDMSAFTMFTLTLILSAFFFTKKTLYKAGYISVFACGFWLLVLGASRSSSLAYLLSIGMLIVLIAIYKRSIVWGITRGFVVLGICGIIFLTLGDVTSRFSQLGFIKQFNEKFSSVVHPLSNGPPKNSIAVDPIDKTDQLPIPQPVIVKTLPIPTVTPKPKKVVTPSPKIGSSILPPDVYTNIPDLKTVTATVGGKTVTQVVEVQRDFSPCTYQYGLSACIRFDTLWPRALWGFKRNPLLGSGYSTLTKGSKDEFTEAESTDNDFLRNLGETGILGVIGFYGPIFIFIAYALDRLEEQHSLLVVSLLLGIIAGTVGMFFNALYIDVFEASKVAFMYWSILGTGFALILRNEQDAVIPSEVVPSHSETTKKSRSL